MLKPFNVPPTNKLTRLKLHARDYIKFSNNVTKLNVVDQLQSNMIDKSQIKSFSAGSNVSALAASCFYECTSLEDVSFKPSTKSIGDQAFYGCTSLASISSLNLPKGGVSDIGNQAFARSGLQDVKLRLNQYADEDINIGEEAFASCASLGSFTFVDSNCIGAQMFKDCTSLTSVAFAKKTECIGYGAFEGCTSLDHLNMPVDIAAIPDNFAAGCTSLATVSFSSSNSLGTTGSLGNRIFSNTAITSLTLPNSITSLDSFSENTLNGMQRLAELHLNGISYKDIMDSEYVQPEEDQPQEEEQPQVDTQYPLNMLYCDEYQYSHVSNAKVSDKNSYMTLNAVSKTVEMIKYCIDNSIPIVGFLSKNGSCGNCSSFISKFIENDYFKNYVKSNSKYLFIYGNTSFKTTIPGMSKTFKDIVNPSKDRYVILIGYCKTQNGNEIKLNECNLASNYTPEAFMSYIDSEFKSVIQQTFNNKNLENAQNSSSQQVIVVKSSNPTIVGTGCFGLNHDVTIYTSEGYPIQFSKSSSSGSLSYSNSVQVDNMTIDDFRYGQWYGRAQFLHPYADSNSIPVLAIATQGDMYTNSKAFNALVFNSMSFQNAITSKSILLCKIDSPMFTGGDAAYLLNDWMSESGTRALPLLMMYWLRKNVDIGIEQPEYVDSAVANFAYFSTSSSAASINGVTCVHNESEVIQWINSLTIYSEYSPQRRFEKPAIQSFLTRYPRYKRYDNQANDSYGRYFPVLQLSAPAVGSSYEVNLNNSEGQPTNYQLVVGSSQGAAVPPPGTYQYFSLLSNDSNARIYDSIYEVSGYMFKVGSPATKTLMKNEQFEYESKTIDAYKTSYSIAESNIQNMISSFDGEMYLIGDDGNPTTDIDPDAVEDMPFLWNEKMRMSLVAPIDVVVDGQTKHVNDIQLWISSQAQLIDDPSYDPDEDDEEVAPKILVPGDTQYVVSSQMYGDIYSNNQLIWLSSFSNGTQNYSLLATTATTTKKQAEKDASTKTTIAISRTTLSTFAISQDDWWKDNDYNGYVKWVAKTDGQKALKKFVLNFRAPFGDPIKLGQWNGYFEQCSAVAMQYEIPMWAVHQLAGTCNSCHDGERVLMYSTDLQNFLENSNLILCFVSARDMHDNIYQKYFEQKKGTGTTYIGSFVSHFFWYKQNGREKVVDKIVSMNDIGIRDFSQSLANKIGNRVIDYIRNQSGFEPYLNATGDLYY